MLFLFLFVILVNSPRNSSLFLSVSPHSVPRTNSSFAGLDVAALPMLKDQIFETGGGIEVTAYVYAYSFLVPYNATVGND